MGTMLPSRAAALERARYLVVRAQLLAVGREGEQPAGGVHHAADLQPIVVADLPGAHALARAHHVAVAAFDAEFQETFLSLYDHRYNREHVYLAN